MLFLFTQGAGRGRFDQVQLKIEKNISDKFPLPEFPAMQRVYNYATYSNYTCLLGEEDSIHQAKLCLYDTEKKVTKTFPVGSIPHGKISAIQQGPNNGMTVCTEENGLMIVDMRQYQNMKAYTFQYNMKPNFWATQTHVHILRKLDEGGFNVTALKININGQNKIEMVNDYSIPIEMRQPYDLRYFHDKDVKCNGAIVIGSHQGVNKVIAVTSRGVSWQVALDQFPVSITGPVSEILIDGDKKSVILILTMKSLVAILETGEIVKTNFAQVSEGIDKMVSVKGGTGAFAIIHASGAEHTLYNIN